MATSGTVAAGDLATATQYNNLRTDVLTTHIHNGTDGAALTFGTPVATGTALAAGTAATYVHSDHVHVATLGTAAGSAAAAVALTVQNTWYIVASAIPGAGIWSVNAHVEFGGGIGGGELRLTFSGSTTRTWTLYGAAVNGGISDIGTITGAGTITFEARRTGVTAGTALAGSHLTALRVG